MPTRAAVNDPFPSDFTALPEGSRVAAYYGYDRQQTGTWTKGQRRGDLGISTQALALRLGSFYRLGGYTVAPVAQLSASDAALSGRSVPASIERQRSGVSDVRLGGAIWFIEDAQARHYLGLSLLTFWPTGTYDLRELVNFGENRRRQTLMLGWIKGLGKHWTLDLMPEIAWYDTNPNSYPGNVRQHQSRTESLTGYLRYSFAPAVEGYVGIQANEGGETTNNGVPQNNPIHSRRYYVGGTWNIDSDNRLNLRYGEDASVFSGLKLTREIALRWVNRF